MDAPFYQQDCTCCAPTEFEEVNVKMICPRKRTITRIIKRIKKCVCNTCNSAPSKDQSQARTQDSKFSDKMKEEDDKIRNRRSVAGRIYDMIFGENE